MDKWEQMQLDGENLHWQSGRDKLMESTEKTDISYALWWKLTEA